MSCFEFMFSRSEGKRQFGLRNNKNSSASTGVSFQVRHFDVTPALIPFLRLSVWYLQVSVSLILLNIKNVTINGWLRTINRSSAFIIHRTQYVTNLQQQQQNIVFRAAVQCGDVIRLLHMNTNTYLHSHHFSAPLTESNQEVSAFEEKRTDTGNYPNMRTYCYVLDLDSS